MSNTKEKDRLPELAGSGIYAACKVGNSVDLYRWVSTVLDPPIMPPEDLHITVCYSKKPFNVERVPPSKPIKLGKDNDRRVGRLGDSIVLFLSERESRALKAVWKSFIDQGATWDYPSYVAHVSIANHSNLSNTALANIKAYSGPLLFMPHYIDALKDSSENASVETAISATVKRAKIKEVKGWIEKYNKTNSESVEVRLKKKIYSALEEYSIEREEVGLPPAKGRKIKAPKHKTKAEAIKEVKALIVKFNKTNSATVEAKTKKTIYSMLKEFGIEREEVGLSPKKTKTKASKEVIEKPKHKLPISVLPVTPFADTQRSKANKLRYMKELWNILNKEKFAGQMKIPNLNLSKAVKVDRLRRRGVWFQDSRRLEVNPHIFNNEELFFEVFLHEMCHQAVSEITQYTVMEPQGGHGPIWKSWMVKVGLDPRRYDPNENLNYMSEEKKAETIKKVEAKKTAEIKEEMIQPREGIPAKWFDKKVEVWRAGIIVCKNDQAGKRWVFVGPSDQYNRYGVIPSTWFYSVDSATSEVLLRTLKTRADELRGKLQAHKALKKEIRQERKTLRSIFGGF